MKQEGSSRGLICAVGVLILGHTWVACGQDEAPSVTTLALPYGIKCERFPSGELAVTLPEGVVIEPELRQIRFPKDISPFEVQIPADVAKKAGRSVLPPSSGGTQFPERDRGFIGQPGLPPSPVELIQLVFPSDVKFRYLDDGGTMAYLPEAVTYVATSRSLRFPPKLLPVSGVVAMVGATGPSTPPPPPEFPMKGMPPPPFGGSGFQPPPDPRMGRQPPLAEGGGVRAMTFPLARFQHLGDGSMLVDLPPGAAYDAEEHAVVFPPQMRPGEALIPAKIPEGARAEESRPALTAPPVSLMPPPGP